ncbi:hypothetical protein [Pseudoalteromonas aurantia]|nr:hypothetical protein CWC20_20595 [Pseudoalteromonas aurantia]
MIDYIGVFNFQVKGEHLYYLDDSSNSLSVIKMNLTNKQQELLLENVSPTKLTIVENGIYYTHIKSHSSDIFRTFDQD